MAQDQRPHRQNFSGTVDHYRRVSEILVLWFWRLLDRQDLCPFLPPHRHFFLTVVDYVLEDLELQKHLHLHRRPPHRLCRQVLRRHLLSCRLRLLIASRRDCIVLETDPKDLLEPHHLYRAYQILTKFLLLSFRFLLHRLPNFNSIVTKDFNWATHLLYYFILRSQCFHLFLWRDFSFYLRLEIVGHLYFRQYEDHPLRFLFVIRQGAPW